MSNEAKIRGVIASETTAAIQIEQGGTRIVNRRDRVNRPAPVRAWISKSIISYSKRGPKPAIHGDRQEIEIVIPRWKFEVLTLKEEMN